MSPEQITQWAKEAGGCQLADYDCAFALNLGSLTRFAALIREADRLHDLTDKEIGKAWRSVKATLPYPEYRRAITKAILEAARKK